MSTLDPQRKLSWSRLETLYLCPQKYAYHYEEAITGGTVHKYTSSEGEERTLVYSYAPALAFGSAWHAAMASIYEGTAFEPVHCPCEDTCEYCERLVFTKGPKEGFYKGRWMYKCIAQFFLHYPWDPDEITDKRNPRTRAKGVELIHAYLDKWKRENFEVVAVEQEFELPFWSGYCADCHDDRHLPGSTHFSHVFRPEALFTYVGVIDLLARQGGELSPRDHKTTKWFGQQFDDQFKLSGQFTGYIEGTEAATGEPVSTAWANGASLSGQPGPDSFRRLETTRTPQDRDRWRQEVLDAWDLIQLYRKRGRWPRHAPQACFAYNHRCEYYELCASGATPDEALKANNYVKIPPRD